MADTTFQKSLQAEDTQQQILQLINRRHPEYHLMLPHWQFCEDTYDGGRRWFEKHIHKYFKEGGDEYVQRVTRAYRFNHTREIVDLVDKYIFKTEIARKDDAPDPVKAFWKRSTLSGLEIDQYMRLNSADSSKLGMTWVFVDNNKAPEAEGASVADEREAGVQIYAYTVKPQDVLDVSFDDGGDINWVLTRQWVRDDNDPFACTGLLEEQFRLWTRNAWFVFKLIAGEKEGDPQRVELVDSGENKLGIVPGRPLRHTIGEGRYSAPALVNDIAYLDRAVANYLSNLDAIIQDQTFSQLAMPAQSLTAGEEGGDPKQKLIEMGTKRIFTYDGESGAKPEYLSPDPKQAGLILTVITKIISEIYHTVGMSGERSKTDNAVGTDNSSGVAKAYDFERLNSLLVSKSESLENLENWLVRMVCRYAGIAEPEDDIVEYPETFDVRSLFDEFTVAEKLVLIEAPDMVRQEQMKQVINKLFPEIKEALKTQMLAELKDWPKDPVEVAAQLAEATGKLSGSITAKSGAGAAPSGTPASGSKTKNPGTASRQGQVTSDTGKKAAAA